MQDLQSGLAGLSQATVESVSSVIERGSLAERVADRAQQLRAAALRLRIRPLLNGVTDLVKTVCEIDTFFLKSQKTIDHNT